MKRLGLLVALEGIDGSGKSTLIRRLASRLRRRGYSVRLRREPSHPELGKRAERAAATDPWTGAVYFTLDRWVALPGLRADLPRFDILLTDRSFYSTLAYQGSRLSIASRRRIEGWTDTVTVRPDLVIWIRLPPSEAIRRLKARSSKRAPLEEARRLREVDRAYERLAKRYRFVRLDGQGPLEETLDRALTAIEERRPPRRPRGRS